MSSGNKILFFVPARLGDALMLTPALALLKKLKPEYQIDIVAFSQLGGSVFHNNPNCNVIHYWAEISDIDSFIKHYDLAIACFRSKAIELVRSMNIPFAIIGGANATDHYALQAANFIKTLFDHANTSVPDYHIFPREPDIAFAQSLLTDPQVTYIGIHLGCHGINKRKNFLPWVRKQATHGKVWPLENFVTLADTIKKHHPSVRFVLTGSAGELGLAQDFMQHHPDAINLMGKTTVLQLGAILQNLAIFICPDTGTMHLACTSSTPVVTLFGPTNPIKTGPYPATPFRRVIQAENLPDLSPLQVFETVTLLLGHFNTFMSR